MYAAQSQTPTLKMAQEQKLLASSFLLMTIDLRCSYNIFMSCYHSAEAEAADPTTQRRVRAAHRGSLTRLMGQLEEALGSDNTRRLKQLRQSLTDKVSLLTRLDDELLKLVGEEQLELEL